MRKLLLASAAMLGATSGLAMAQDSAAIFAPSQGDATDARANPLPPSSSFNTNNNAYGNVVGHVGGAAYAANADPDSPALSSSA